MPTSTELRRARAGLVEEARGLIDAAEAENRDLNGEETEQYDRIEADIQASTRRIERQEASERRAREMASFDDDPPAPGDDDGDDGVPSVADQFRALAAGERRGVEVTFSETEKRAGLLTEPASQGGATVPETFIGQLFEHLTETSTVRQTGVQNITTASGEKLYWPKVTEYGTAGRVGQAQPLPEGDPSFGQVEIDAHKYGRILHISTELLTDTGVDLQGFIARDAGRAIGEATGQDYLNGGSQSNRPDGLVPNAVTGVEADSSSAIAFDELIDLYYSVIGPYRANAQWLVHDSTAALLRKIKDEDGQYLWQPSVREGQPDRLLGRPVLTDPHMPSVESGARAVLFGAFSAYLIRDVGQVRFERSDDYRFSDDVVSFRVIFRTDGKYVDTSGAVKALVMGSSGGGGD